MLCRSLAATLMLLIWGNSVRAETYHGLLVELTDSKLAIRTVEGEKTTLDVGGNVRVFQPKGEGEKLLPFAEVQKLVTATVKEKVVKGVLASVSTDNNGRV